MVVQPYTSQSHAVVSYCQGVDTFEGQCNIVLVHYGLEFVCSNMPPISCYVQTVVLALHHDKLLLAESVASVSRNFLLPHACWLCNLVTALLTKTM